MIKKLELSLHLKKKQLTNYEKSVIMNIENEREVKGMKALKYEYNGTIYNTKRQAPEGATAIFVPVREDTATYKPERVAKLREKLRAKRAEQESA